MAEEAKKKCNSKLRNIYLFGEISDESALDFIADLHELEREDIKKPITVFINSPGGDCSSGFAIIDALFISKCPIITVAIGEVCSMAPGIFIAGEKRYITKNASIMFHPITTYSSDYISFAKSRLKNSEDIEKQFDKLILSRSKMPVQAYKQAKIKEVWLNASKAIETGIAHGYYKETK